MASFQVGWKNSALKELQKLPRQLMICRSIHIQKAFANLSVRIMPIEFGWEIIV